MIDLRKILEVVRLGVIVLAVALAALFLFGGCASTPQPEPAGSGADWSAKLHTIDNPYHSPVIRDRGDKLEILKPPPLRFTGVTATAAEVQQWAKENGINVRAVYADSNYAQLESESAIQLALWLKRALHDLGYTYYGDARDCDNFARIFRTFPDFFTRDDGAQALVFGIYARMDYTFAGISDGYHALNAAWTDKGVPVFEPQGWRQLIFQDIRAWPNLSGINDIKTD